MTERVDPFANLASFKPKEGEQPKADKEAIEKISKDNGFPSREAPPPAPEKRARFSSRGPKKQKQLNVKVSDACYERFYQMAERRGIRALGDLIDQALDALEKNGEQDADNM